MRDTTTPGRGASSSAAERAVDAGADTDALAHANTDALADADIEAHTDAQARRDAWLRASAALGALAWAAALLPPWPFTGHVLWIERVVALGALVIAPLALLGAGAPAGPHTAWHRVAARAQPMCAGLALASVCLRPGAVAGSLAAAWLLGAALIGATGLVRLLARGYRPVEELAIDAGMMYLPVGAVWLVASRMGVPLLGFSEPWVMLTAAHFHYAGLAAPVLAGLVGRALHAGPAPEPGWVRAHSLAAAGAMLGPPLVAAGIALWPAVEVVSAWMLALALLVLAAVALRRVVPRLRPRLAGALLALSVSSLLASMSLACAYATGAFLGVEVVSLATMVRLHGLVNALGFGACGLAAFALAPPRSRWQNARVPFSRLAARWRVGPRFFHHIDAVDPAPARAPAGLVDDLEAYRRDGNEDERDSFDPDRVHPDIRAFYERTASFRLFVIPDWRPGFRLGARLFRWLMGSIDQLGLPRDPVADEQMQSCILPIRDERDGRRGVRAWVRTYERPDGRAGPVVYVAAYSVHRAAGVPYMNIAFPLPGGNMTSILRMDAWPDPVSDGLVLTTLPVAGAARGLGDQGVYFASRWLPVRLPFDETITVATPARAAALGIDPRATPDGAGAATVLARHDMWLFGVRFLSLTYWLVPGAAAGSRPAD